MDVICTVDRLVNVLQYLQASDPSSVQPSPVQRTYPFETVVPQIDFIQSSRGVVIPQITKLLNARMKFISATQCLFVSFWSDGRNFTPSDTHVLNIINSMRKTVQRKRVSTASGTYYVNKYSFEETNSLVHTISDKIITRHAQNNQDLELRINEKGDFIRIQNDTGDWTKFLKDIVAPDA